MGKFPIQIISLGKQIEFLGSRMEFVESPIQGDTYFSNFRGSSLEFKGHREYSIQDDSKDIDWKASLRSDKLLVKEYYQEKGMDVVFLYDVSETMLFGSQNKIKAQYGAEFILALAGVAIEANYNVGLVCFSDKINKSFTASSSGNQIGLFFGILQEHSTYGGGYDLANALEFVDSLYGPGTVVILVSDFLGSKIPFEHFEDKFKQLTSKFDVISVILRDPRDEFMPSENVGLVISSPYGKGDVFFNTNKIKKEYEIYTKDQKDKLKKFLSDVRSDHFEIYTDKPFIDSTIAFFTRRNALWS